MWESEKRPRFLFHSEQGFFPPFPLVNWKPPSSGGNVWYGTVVKMSLQHFSSSELCPPGPIIPAQRDAGFFAFLSYANHFFRDFFQHLVHNTLQKNRGEIQVYHETPPEDDHPVFSYWEGSNISECEAQLPAQAVYCALSGNELHNQGVCLHLLPQSTAF